MIFIPWGRLSCFGRPPKHAVVCGDVIGTISFLIFNDFDQHFFIITNLQFHMPRTLTQHRSIARPTGFKQFFNTGQALHNITCFGALKHQ